MTRLHRLPRFRVFPMLCDKHFSQSSMHKVRTLVLILFESEKELLQDSMIETVKIFGNTGSIPSHFQQTSF